MRNLLALVLIALGFITGCDSGGEKNKNRDKDVPKPARTEPN